MGGVGGGGADNSGWRNSWPAVKNFSCRLVINQLIVELKWHIWRDERRSAGIKRPVRLSRTVTTRQVQLKYTLNPFRAHFTALQWGALEGNALTNQNSSNTTFLPLVQRVHGWQQQVEPNYENQPSPQLFHVLVTAQWLVTFWDVNDPTLSDLCSVMAFLHSGSRSRWWGARFRHFEDVAGTRRSFLLGGSPPASLHLPWRREGTKNINMLPIFHLSELVDVPTLQRLGVCIFRAATLFSVMLTLCSSECLCVWFRNSCQLHFQLKHDQMCLYDFSARCCQTASKLNWAPEKREKKMWKNTMSCCSIKLKQRLHIHRGESHKREFHGAELTLGGFVRGMGGGGGGTHGLSAQREVDIFTRHAGVEVWMPAGGHIRGVCVCFWVESKDGRFTAIEMKMEGAGLLIPRTKKRLWEDTASLGGVRQHLIRFTDRFDVSLSACLPFSYSGLTRCVCPTCRVGSTAANGLNYMEVS